VFALLKILPRTGRRGAGGPAAVPSAGALRPASRLRDWDILVKRRPREGGFRQWAAAKSCQAVAVSG